MPPVAHAISAFLRQSETTEPPSLRETLDTQSSRRETHAKEASALEMSLASRTRGCSQFSVLTPHASHTTPSSRMDTIELTLDIPPPEHDRYVARLETCATGFVQDDAELRAYVPTNRWADIDRETLDARLAADGYPNALTVRPLAAKNWNAIWEDTLSPVRAGPFLVCPTSTEVPPTRDEVTVLRIDPEMSFGTGHHATTRLALRLLGETLAAGDRMLDVGTGTGLLAIAACRSGAAGALGVDTSPKAVRNARDNARQNEVADCVAVREGSMEQVPDTHYDVVAANITRRIVLDLLPDLAGRLAPDGTLLLSGILRPQRDDILDAATAHDLQPDTEITEEGWWAVSLSPLPQR